MDLRFLEIPGSRLWILPRCELHQKKQKEKEALALFAVVGNGSTLPYSNHLV